VVASGGRVLAVTGLADSAADARARAYDAVTKINWPEGFYRRDIAGS
jgi:phosphoribosylamine--glycine ligase